MAKIDKNIKKTSEKEASYKKIVHTKLNDTYFKEIRDMDFSENDLKFISSLSAAVLQKSTSTSKILLFVIFLLVIAFILWASLSTIDEVTRASGKVIPSHQIQKVQHLEGGIVTQILIKEGDIVKKGQALIQIDSVGSKARFQESKIRLFELEAKASRLKAQINRGKIFFNPTIEKGFKEIVQEERSLFNSRMAEFEQKIGILDERLKQRRSEIIEARNVKDELIHRYESIKEEIKITQPLVDKQLISEVEFLKLKRQASKIKGALDASELSIPRLKSKISEAENSISEAKLKFSNKAKEEYNEVISEIARIEHTNTLLKDKVYKLDLRSPVDGTVKQLLTNTIGGVVHPGQDIVELVPLEDSLISEVKVRPSDIAYLYKGQSAIVKFSAYDFSIYGGLKGKVTHISADTITDDRGDSHYLVLVKTDKSFLGTQNKQLRIMVGMTVTVDILTGKKTILDYIMKPILKTKENALKER